MAQKKPFVAKYGIDVGSNTVFSNNNILHANNTINNFTITSDMLARTGIQSAFEGSNTSQEFGSASKIPVFTVGADGRIISISNTAVSGLTGVTYTAANNTLTINTADGANFTATIDQLEWDNYMTVANAQALIVSVVANTLSTANASLGFDNRMLVANTRALYNTLVANTLSTANATSQFNDRMQVANTRALYATLVGNTFSTANASSLESTLTASIATKMSAANTRALYTTLQSNTLSTANATSLFNDRMQVANTRSLYTALQSNTLSTANANVLFDDRMQVANTRSLINNLSANVLSTANATVLFDDRMQVANTRSLINNLSANVLSTANATLDTIVSTGNNTTLAISTGDLTAPTITSNTQLVTDFIDFTPKSHPTHSEGRFFYDSVHNTFNFQNDISGINFELGTNEYVRVYNNSGSTITKGTPVAFNGIFQGEPVAAEADSSSSTLYEFRGLASEDIANSAFGYITSAGVVREIDTSGLSLGSVFVDDVAGELTNIEPQSPNFPYCVGEVLVSNTTVGEIYVMPQNHSLPSLRVINDAYVDGDLTVSGNLSILGTQSTIDVNNLEVADTFVYLNGGDTIGEDNTNFTGTGLDDAVFTGHYEGTTTQTFYVRIDGVGTGTGGVDTFEWSLDNFSTTEATGVDITGDDQALQDNISINFVSTTGHTSGDKWDGTASPVNVDVGIVSNRNTGATGVGYTHLGVFYDVSSTRFRLFDVYDPEPEGSIDINHASYRRGDVEANNIYGTLLGNANTASALATARNIAITGDVSGNTNFDGTGDITITTNINSTGTPTGTFGSGSLVPVITVAEDGRITNVSNTSIGVSAFTYTASNTTFEIDTADGSNFTATIDVLKSTDSFANNDTQLLTAAATTDKILELLPRIYDVANTQVFP